MYAVVSDLPRLGIPTTAFGTLTTVAIQAELDAAGAWINSRIRGRYKLPLLAWDDEIRRIEVRVAVYNAMSLRGYNPTAGADVELRRGYEDAERWCDGVQRRAIHPDVTESASDSALAQPFVITSSVVDMNGRTATNRGW